MSNIRKLWLAIAGLLFLAGFAVPKIFDAITNGWFSDYISWIGWIVAITAICIVVAFWRKLADRLGGLLQTKVVQFLIFAATAYVIGLYGYEELPKLIQQETGVELRAAQIITLILGMFLIPGLWKFFEQTDLIPGKSGEVGKGYRWIAYGLIGFLMFTYTQYPIKFFDPDTGQSQFYVRDENGIPAEKSFRGGFDPVTGDRLRLGTKNDAPFVTSPDKGLVTIFLKGTCKVLFGQCTLTWEDLDPRRWFVSAHRIDNKNRVWGVGFPIAKGMSPIIDYRCYDNPGRYRVEGLNNRENVEVHWIDQKGVEHVGPMGSNVSGFRQLWFEVKRGGPYHAYISLTKRWGATHCPPGL